MSATSTSLIRRVPAGMIATRLMISPLMIVGAVWEWPRLLLVVMLGTAFWLDVFDGVVARRLDVATPGLRRADSLCDVIFYLTVIACVAIAEPLVFSQLKWLIAGLVGVEVICQMVSYGRFGCTTSTHSWLCKAWGILLCLVATVVLGRGEANAFVFAALGAGFIAYLDVFLILLLSKSSPVDVPTAWHAWTSRREISLQQS